MPRTSPAASTQPNRLPGSVSQNQQLADAVAERLNQSALLKNFRVNIAVQDGTIELAGSMLTHEQRVAALQIAQSTPGVRGVRDRLQVALAGVVQTAQAAPLQGVPQQPLPPVGQPPKAIVNPNQPPPGFPPGVPQQPLPPGFQPGMPPGFQPGMPPGFQPGMPGMQPYPPAASGGAPGAGGVMEPLPLRGTPPGFPSATQPPPMPPYAWPTYAPYNNYSRVAYPTLYPYESFPFIGPFYPFPKVPLGWRSVSLTWTDGHWWLGRNATGYDWWRVRYW